MHDESTSRQKVDDDVQEGALPPYLLDRDQTQRAKVNLGLSPANCDTVTFYGID